MCMGTCGMLVWKVVDRYFHSIDLHNHVSVPRVQVNITTRAEMKNVCFVSLWVKTTVSFLFIMDTHMSAIFTLIWFCSM